MLPILEFPFRMENIRKETKNRLIKEEKPNNNIDILGKL